MYQTPCCGMDRDAQDGPTAAWPTAWEMLFLAEAPLGPPRPVFPRKLRRLSRAAPSRCSGGAAESSP